MTDPNPVVDADTPTDLMLAEGAPHAYEARYVETIAELAALPVGSIVLANEEAWTLRWPGNGWTVCPRCEITYNAEDLLDYCGEPVTVLHTPEPVSDGE